MIPPEKGDHQPRQGVEQSRNQLFLNRPGYTKEVILKAPRAKTLRLGAKLVYYKI